MWQIEGFKPNNYGAVSIYTKIYFVEHDACEMHSINKIENATIVVYPKIKTNTVITDIIYGQVDNHSCKPKIIIRYVIVMNNVVLKASKNNIFNAITNVSKLN